MMAKVNAFRELQSAGGEGVASQTDIAAVRYPIYKFQQV